MNSLLPEHLRFVFSFLEPKQQLILGTTGEKYECVIKKKDVHVIRKKAVRKLCADMFYKMFHFSDDALLFNNKDETIEELKKTKLYTNKYRMEILCRVYCKWIADYILRKNNYSLMEYGSEITYYVRKRHRYQCRGK